MTVITPAYNVAKYIGEAVDSVLGQTFTDFEYLLVDDGSVDNSAEVARAHAADDPRFSLLNGEHRGVSAARNAAIRKASGKYIAFLDGDDRWHPDFLKRQVGLIESLPPDVGAVFCRSRMILENGTLVFFQWQRSGPYDFDDFLVSLNPARNGSSLLVRATCFNEVGGFDEELGHIEDLEMWLRIAERSSTPVFWASKHFLLDLRLRPGSASRDRTNAQLVLNQMLETQTAKLKRLPGGLAYVRPAVAAFKYGSNEELAERWAAQARQAGTARLLRSTAGVRMLFWQRMRPAGRRAVRSLQSSAREAVKSANLRVRGGVSPG